MEKTYIQFLMPDNPLKEKSHGTLALFFQKIVVRILNKIIPKANPDFENKLQEVKIWLVECDTKTGIPEREIGLDNTGQVIVAMPFKNNYGYWTDNNLKLEDFQSDFETAEIEKEKFFWYWDGFTKQL